MSTFEFRLANSSLDYPGCGGQRQRIFQRRAHNHDDE